MQTIESFKVDHLTLKQGLYLSRQDRKGEVIVSTFDLRFTAPNDMPVMDMPAIHTIEHLGATFLRNSSKKDEIVYFGPMGCRTGFYLIMFGLLRSEQVYPLVKEMCEFIIGFDGEIPGATDKECGNYTEQNLKMAKYYTKEYLDELIKFKRFEY